MSERVSDTIGTAIEAFFGGAFFTLAKGGVRTDGAQGGQIVLVREIAAEPEPFHFVLRRSGLPFSPAEIAMAGEVADVLRIFFDSDHNHGEKACFRTALLLSLMDVAIYRHLRFDRDHAFRSIQKLMQILKHLSCQRCEGKPATSGFIVYRNKLESFQLACSMSDCLMYDFNPRIGVSANFFRNPLTYRLVNGFGSFYSCNVNLQTTGMVKFMNYGTRDAVERLGHRDTFSLIKNAGEGTLVAAVTPSSELEVLTCPDKILVWRKGVWSLFDPDIYRFFLKGHLDAGEAEALIATVYCLSKLRLGAIILIAERDVLDKGDLKKGAVGGKDALSQLIVSFHREKTISDLKHSGELISLLSSDGMTVFNKEGKLIDAGIIINTCTSTGLVTGGGRTTAATAAAVFGKVIKISEDGPIELYENGKCMYRFG